MRIFSILAIAGLLLATAAANATPILTNGSFETGDFTGWTVTGNTGFTNVASSFGPTPQDGTYDANFGPVGSDGFLGQSFSDTSGQTYNLSFWFASDGGSPADFSASINSTTLLSISPVPGSGYTHYSFNFTGTGSDTLTFANRNDPAFNYLDNISVTSAAIPVPEPGTLPLLVTGLLALFMLRRRKIFAR